MAAITVYTLGARGVVLDKSAVHTADSDLLEAANFQVDAVGGRGSVRRRDSLRALTAAPLAGAVVGGVGVPLPDRSQLTRLLCLPLNGGPSSFLISSDGVTWSPSAQLTTAVGEVTLGVENLTLAAGDGALFWQGLGDVLYYPGGDYPAGGPAWPSIHAWDGDEDVPVVRIPPNPHDAGNTFGPFGVTSILPYSETQLIVAVADRTSTIGRARILLLDFANGRLAQVGGTTDLASGHILSGITVWQGRIWISGTNRVAGSPLVTRWARVTDDGWTLDDSFGTTHGYCTGLCVFRGELYQGSAADVGSNGLIRKRRLAAGSAVSRSTTVAGQTTVAGYVTLPIGATSIPVTDLSVFSAGAGAAQIGTQAIAYTGRTASGLLANPGSATPTPLAGAVAASVTPIASAQPGPGLETGAHDFAMTVITPAGESLPGPRTTISVAPLTPPASAPSIVDVLQSGAVDAGWHDYVVTFLCGSGETTPGPISVQAQTIAGTPGTPGGPTTVLLSPPASPPTIPTIVYAGSGSNPLGVYQFAYTFVTASGETTLSPALTVTITDTRQCFTLGNIATGPSGVIARRVYMLVTSRFLLCPNVSANFFNNNSATSYLNGFVLGSLGAEAPTTNTATVPGPPSPGTPAVPGYQLIVLGTVPTGPPGTTARHLFRRFNGTGPFRFAGEVGGNVNVTFQDGTSNDALGYEPPSVNTAWRNRVAITMPLGPIGVIARRLYRTAVGSGQLQLSGTVNDNVTTDVGIADNPDSTLGDPAPTVDFSGLTPGSSLTTPGWHGVAVTWGDAFAGETLPSVVGLVYVLPGYGSRTLTLPIGPTGTAVRRLYLTAAQATLATMTPELAPFLLAALIPDNTTSTFILNVADSSRALPGPPTVNTTVSPGGTLTGVTGVTAQVAPGSLITVAVPVGGTTIPVADTTNFLSAGGVATISYSGRSTVSGPGHLTGVTGVTTRVNGGASISVLVAAASGWATVHSADGTGAGNYCGPFIVTADGALLLAFQNSVGGAAPQLRILSTVDGVAWTTEYNITAALGNGYGRSGMPILDDNGDIYWPLASASLHLSGGLLKRTATGVWSVVLSGLTTVRGPIGIVRVA